MIQVSNIGTSWPSCFKNSELVYKAEYMQFAMQEVFPTYVLKVQKHMLG